MSQSRLNVLVAGYAKMTDRVHDVLVDRGDKIISTLSDALDSAQEEASRLGELTQEETGKLRRWLERDLYAIAEWRDRTGSELQQWLPVEVRAEEAWLLSRMMAVADSTTLELLALKEQAQGPDHGLWLAGEVTGSGVLQCTECSKSIELVHAGVIPECSECSGLQWQRQS